MKETKLVVGEYACVRQEGPHFNHIYTVTSIDLDKEIVKMYGRDYPLASVVPCCTKKNTKVGDVVQTIVISRDKDWDRDAEVLEVHATSMRVRFEDGRIIADAPYVFCRKEDLFPTPPEPQEQPLSLELFFANN